MTNTLLYTGFVDQALNFPERTAVVNGKTRLSYKDLYEKSLYLSGELIAENKNPSKNTLKNTLTGIYMDKGWEQIVAVLGILFSGAAYLPLDPALPEERMHYLLTAGEVKHIIIQKKYAKKIKNFFSENNHQKIIILEDCLKNYLNNYLNNNNININNPDDLAYVIFTSGSTGYPKGVAIEHGAVVNTVKAINNRFKINAQDAVLGLSALNFDLSVYDIFGILGAGGKIVLPAVSELYEPLNWLRLIQQESITIWNSVPAFLQMFLDGCADEMPDSLRVFLLSGDWILLRLAKKMASLAPKANIISLGGATEASIWSVLYDIKTIDPHWKSIPYGKALLGQTVEILDENLNTCAEGTEGEIYIGGKGLAREYWQDRAKTKQSFIVHPVTSKKLYKTGDLGKYHPDGNIEILGRKDSQIKINGCRIELAEIESVLNRYFKIKNSLAIVHQQKIQVYIETDTAGASEKKYLNLLSQKLPDYMIPEKIFFLKKFPLTSNGKVDRNLLPQKIFEKNKNHKIYFAENSIQKKIIYFWEKILDYTPVSITDNFFKHGGSSLKAVSLISDINREFNLSLPVSMILQTMTIKKLSAKIEALRDKNPIQALSSARLVKLKDGKKPPLFLIHPVSGEIFCYLKLAEKLNKHQAVYALEAQYTTPEWRIESAAAHYCTLLEKIQPEGPYYLAGWSIGGLIAFEMAVQLTQKKQKNISFLGLFDTYPPIDLLLNTAFKFSTEKIIKNILSYYCQEILKIINSENTRNTFKINLDNFCGVQPLTAIDQIFSIIQHHYAEKIQKNSFFLKNFTDNFKHILNGMINYKIRSKSVRKIFFLRSEETPQEFSSLWQTRCEEPIFIAPVKGAHITMLAEKHSGDFARILEELMPHA